MISDCILYTSPVTGVPSAVVPAVDAESGVGVAFVAVSIAEAGLAGGEAPVTWQTALTLSPVCPGNANTLTGQLIAK